MGNIIGRGRYATATYPQSARAGGGGGSTVDGYARLTADFQAGSWGEGLGVGVQVETSGWYSVGMPIQVENANATQDGPGLFQVFSIISPTSIEIYPFEGTDLVVNSPQVVPAGNRIIPYFVRGVAGTPPIAVDNTDPSNPVVSSS